MLSTCASIETSPQSTTDLQHHPPYPWKPQHRQSQLLGSCPGGPETSHKCQCQPTGVSNVTESSAIDACDQQAGNRGLVRRECVAFRVYWIESRWLVSQPYLISGHGSWLVEWDEFHDAIVIDEMASCGALGTVWGRPSTAAPLSVGLLSTDTGSKHTKETIWHLCLEDNSVIVCALPNRRVCINISFMAEVLTAVVGSDVAGIVTTARKSPNGKSYIPNGEKKWVTQGRWATHGLVVAHIGGPGHKGISCFMVG